MELNKEIILATIRNDLPALEKKYGVTSIGLFGSFVKNKQTAESDIDFFVELKEPLANNFFGLWDYLEKKLNHKIDIVRKGEHLRKTFINTIEKEIVYA